MTLAQLPLVVQTLIGRHCAYVQGLPRLFPHHPPIQTSPISLLRGMTSQEEDCAAPERHEAISPLLVQ
jgi:hypothetical protein